tara:strand:- start:6982 stop:8058 length:1077 start_codon:yes stop_codon:yes gene_type:complete
VESVNADSIGDIAETTGVASILRNDDSLLSSVGLDIDLFDTARTGNGRMLIEFEDEAELALTEHTQVLIDEVIYDPNPDKSKMSMRMVMGTARFASGKLSMVNKKNIDIRTPTATIAIRGTDFTTTIDELGRSLIVLLPDEFGDASGEITVINEGGEVTLNEAYQATMVSTISSMPTQPVTLQNINVNQINNMFIVNPPTEVREAIQEAAQENQDSGILDVDFLEFNELEQDALADGEKELEFSELDIDFLDVDFLTDLLDVIEDLDKKVAGSGDSGGGGAIGTFRVDGAVAGFNKESQYNVFEQDGDLLFYRNVNGVIALSFRAGSNVSLETIVDGYEGVITIGEGGEIFISITQTN